VFSLSAKDEPWRELGDENGVLFYILYFGGWFGDVIEKGEGRGEGLFDVMLGV